MKHFEKVNFHNLDHFGKTQWKTWWTESADLKGQEQRLARDLMSSLWWTAWKKVTSEIIDNDMSVCCAIYPPASTAKGLLILIIICMPQLGHWTCPSPARVRNVLAQVLHKHNEMCMEQHLLHHVFPTYVQTRTCTSRGSLPIRSTMLKYREQQCLRGRINQTTKSWG